MWELLTAIFVTGVVCSIIGSMVMVTAWFRS
jgi:hypothetical protein